MGDSPLSIVPPSWRKQLLLSDELYMVHHQNWLCRRCMDGGSDWWNSNVGDWNFTESNTSGNQNSCARYTPRWITAKECKVRIKIYFLVIGKWNENIRHELTFGFARLQLMCYKYLWDSLVADKFPSRNFFDFFSLNPHYILSEDIRTNIAKSGFPAEVNNFIF